MNRRTVFIMAGLLLLVATSIFNLWAEGPTTDGNETITHSYIPTPTPTLVYRQPWENDTNIQFSRSWHNPETGNDGLDFRRQAPYIDEIKVYAAANGKLIDVCHNDSLDVAYIVIKHEENQTLWYLHLKWSSVPSWIKEAWNTHTNYINREISIVQGQLLGKMKSGTFSDSECDQYADQQDTTAHLHLDVPSQDLTIDGWHIRFINGRSDCFEKADETPICEHETNYVLKSHTIEINCDANQPFIGSKVCRKTNALVRPGFINGFPRENIEFFSHPIGSGQEQALGVVMRDSLMLTTEAGPFVNPYNPDQISWQVRFVPGVSQIFLYPDVNIDLTGPVWVVEGDIDEINRPSFTDTQFASPFFVYEEIVAQAKIFRGYSDGSFGPEMSILRKDMALVIFRVMNGGDNPTCEVLIDPGQACGDIQWTFGDVNNPTELSHLAVEWLARQQTINGEPVVSGTSDICNDKPCFKPDEPISKAEFTTLSVKALQTNPVYDTLEIEPCLASVYPDGYQFPDVEDVDGDPTNGSQQSPHASYIYVACGLGIVEGEVLADGVRYFGHDQEISREKGAKILAGMYMILSNAGAFDSVGNGDNGSSLTQLDNNNLTTSNFIATSDLVDNRWAIMSNNTCQLYYVGHYEDGRQVSVFDFGNISNPVHAFGPLQKGVTLTAIELDPITHRFYGVTAKHNEPSKLYRIDPYLGSVTLIGEIRDNSGRPYKNISDLEITTEGVLTAYVNTVGVRNRGIIVIDTTTAIATTTERLSQKMDAIAINPLTGEIWTATQKKLFTLDSSGHLVRRYTLRVPGSISAMEFRPDGLLWLILDHAHSIKLYAMDLETGQILAVNEFSVSGVEAVTGLTWTSWCNSSFKREDQPESSNNGINLLKNISLSLEHSPDYVGGFLSVATILTVSCSLQLPYLYITLGKKINLALDNSADVDGSPSAIVQTESREPPRL